MKDTGISDYKEKASHGDVLMPMQRYRCIVPFSYQDLSLHWHDEVEFTWIEDGSIDYDINFETFRVQKDDLLLISPHTLHSAHALKEEEMISESLVFHLDMLGYQTPDACTIKYISPLLKGKYRFIPVIRAGAPGHEELLQCFREMLTGVEDKNHSPLLCREVTPGENRKREGNELYMKELLFRFFRLLYQNGYVVKNENSATDSELERKLKTVLTYIREHYTEAMTIEDLAEVCHFSQAHFMSFFKKFAGMTCVEYINHYRLSRVAASLAQSDQPVMEAALENGFHNISYFNKLFRKEFGVTPKQYRKEAGAPVKSNFNVVYAGIPGGS